MSRKYSLWIVVGAALAPSLAFVAFLTFVMQHGKVVP